MSAVLPVDLGRAVLDEFYERVLDGDPIQFRDPSSVLIPPRRFYGRKGVQDVLNWLTREQGGNFLVDRFGYTWDEVLTFSMLVSELGENVAEHAWTTGWLAAWIARDVRSKEPRLVLAVLDGGQGLKGSLGQRHGIPFPPRLWSDAEAIRKVFLETRTDAPPRRRGMAMVRQRVNRMGGVLQLRSGTAAIELFPDQSWRLDTDLPVRRGVQATILLPPRVETMTKLIWR